MASKRRVASLIKGDGNQHAEVYFVENDHEQKIVVNVEAQSQNQNKFVAWTGKCSQARASSTLVSVAAQFETARDALLNGRVYFKDGVLIINLDEGENLASHRQWKLRLKQEDTADLCVKLAAGGKIGAINSANLDQFQSWVAAVNPPRLLLKRQEASDEINIEFHCDLLRNIKREAESTRDSLEEHKHGVFVIHQAGKPYTMPRFSDDQERNRYAEIMTLLEDHTKEFKHLSKEAREHIDRLLREADEAKTQRMCKIKDIGHDIGHLPQEGGAVSTWFHGLLERLRETAKHDRERLVALRSEQRNLLDKSESFGGQRIILKERLQTIQFFLADQTETDQKESEPERTDHWVVRLGQNLGISVAITTPGRGEGQMDILRPKLQQHIAYLETQKGRAQMASNEVEAKIVALEKEMGELKEHISKLQDIIYFMKGATMPGTHASREPAFGRPDLLQEHVSSPTYDGLTEAAKHRLTPGPKTAYDNLIHSTKNFQGTLREQYNAIRKKHEAGFDPTEENKDWEACEWQNSPHFQHVEELLEKLEAVLKTKKEGEGNYGILALGKVLQQASTEIRIIDGQIGTIQELLKESGVRVSTVIQHIQDEITTIEQETESTAEKIKEIESSIKEAETVVQTSSEAVFTTRNDIADVLVLDIKPKILEGYAKLIEKEVSDFQAIHKANVETIVNYIRTFWDNWRTFESTWRDWDGDDIITWICCADEPSFACAWHPLLGEAHVARSVFVNRREKCGPRTMDKPMNMNSFELTEPQKDHARRMEMHGKFLEDVLSTTSGLGRGAAGYFATVYQIYPFQACQLITKFFHHLMIPRLESPEPALTLGGKKKRPRDPSTKEPAPKRPRTDDAPSTPRQIGSVTNVEPATPAEENPPQQPPTLVEEGKAPPAPVIVGEKRPRSGGEELADPERPSKKPKSVPDHIEAADTDPRNVNGADPGSLVAPTPADDDNTGGQTDDGAAEKRPAEEVGDETEAAKSKEEGGNKAKAQEEPADKEEEKTAPEEPARKAEEEKTAQEEPADKEEEKTAQEEPPRNNINPRDIQERQDQVDDMAGENLKERERQRATREFGEKQRIIPPDIEAQEEASPTEMADSPTDSPAEVTPEADDAPTDNPTETTDAADAPTITSSPTETTDGSDSTEANTPEETARQEAEGKVDWSERGQGSGDADWENSEDKKQMDVLFAALDTDGNGSIDSDEFKKSFGQDDVAMQLLKKMDANDDGDVSRNEWNKVMKESWIKTAVPGSAHNTPSIDTPETDADEESADMGEAIPETPKTFTRDEALTCELASKSNENLYSILRTIDPTADDGDYLVNSSPDHNGISEEEWDRDGLIGDIELARKEANPATDKQA